MSMTSHISTGVGCSSLYSRRFLIEGLLGVGNLVFSSFAGLFHKMVNLPLDVVSTRQHTARDESTTMENARAIQVCLGFRS
jgi:hypothetical protein